MAELSDLLEKIDENCNNIDKEIVIKAYDFAHEAHKDQMRESGEPYISHPLDVACILAEMGMDMSTIVAGILHDVIEDTSYSYDDITEMFSSEVADLVSGVTKLDKITYKTKEEQQADNVRKMLLAMAKDIRVILIKLADRLHNMRTLKFKREQKQREKAKETLDIYAPLAHRLGMSKIKWELEDLSFRYLKPKEYYELVDLIAEKRVEREEYISKIVDDLKSNLEASGIIPDIDGRPKHFYSIYRKMLNKSKSLDQIFDLTAVRILVNNIKECYAALGIVHTMYKPIPGRFKDYIAMPKPNMYQSLHSTVIGPEGKPFEIQIRTYDMHKTAEYGIAAHWKYKEGIVENPQNIPQSKSSNKDDTKLTWIREMLEWQRETPSAQEFMENFKIDLFSDEIFVFTPKGKVINLPYNATPVDFAYKIHTDVGNRCVGAKVNGKIVPLDYKLKTGEIVDILTTSLIKGPNINWLNSVTSNQAKSKIRSWFKKAKRDENISKGKELLEKESKKQEFNFGEIAKGENLDLVLKRYNMNSIDDLYASVGIGAVGASVILARFKDIYEKTKEHEHTNEEILENVKKNIHKENVAKKSYKNDQPGVTVKGVSDVLVRFAKCCTPVPGDPIIGYITKGRGVSVHRTDCTNVNNLIKEDGSRIIEVKWGKSKNESYIAEVEIKAEDRQALLADVVEVISYLEVGIESVNAKTSKGSMAYLNLKLKIQDIDHLAVLMQKLKRLPGIIDIYRTNS
ncbi:bifunctional (p)ppGpp synthetase/guanosine-3',5'-bis(diphosphate) 3'-pyrophosphohydrolase [Clostridium felsineum]|uniref:RelA/SpoT family protein n=1 Tax=Clostridium felsineum TaxID=36839 RepID=UPI00098CEBC1|nr:bifunctional (p)ppGpp synthetase/guanosine-3',5'-bis(diphosphate) 3'-pyrophosphohydrolase [Clostridium felsineum]MCR3759079.1 bifunctional (p)ppGpp synthetase/guanosine-3',5'-bis(diphosphate) 3'-pyrophosphohydrolase [Clostridium felsineum]URZ16760.1 GTP pyrophosphokinase [Clostridium felsineum DSM 794]